MSIASEISRLQQAKLDIEAAIEAKGITVPDGTTLTFYNTYITQITGGGGLELQWNGVDLTARTNLDIRGNYNLIKDDSVADSTKLLLTGNLPKDAYINQNVYPALEWVWYHSDGYWYMVTMVLSQMSGTVGSAIRKFIIYKTKDWVNFTEVVTYEANSTWTEPKICLDSDGNILVVLRETSNNRFEGYFFNASNNYSVTSASLRQNTTYAPETTISLNVSSDNRFGVAFFQKHAGSATYSQLMYIERSAGTSGTWGTVEILGSTPVRAATGDSGSAINLFYTSGNEPIIAFVNNQSATSSKVAIAKKVSGTWSVYDSAKLSVSNSVINSNNNVYCSTSGSTILFDYSNNSISDVSLSSRGISNDSSDNLYYNRAAISLVGAPGIINLYYCKNSDNTFHRAVRPYFQVGAVISANAYSSFGIYTVIPYSRQRLTNAYHLVVRTDGAIYMEII